MNNLSSFTDILGDEIENSQPISLPSSISSIETRENLNSPNNNTSSINRPAKGTGQYGEFRSVEEIDSKYRNIFSHSFFNVVQSRVIDDALYSDKSMVICAPTGSGKTVIFEMAIVQLLMSLDDKEYTGDFKIIYMAPVKALCTERLSEWYPKFTKLGLLCIEVTGDTDVDFSQLKPYRIIITTPEKWDMLTRRWRDHKSLVEVIKLFLIDEVHILNDETRGPVLEAVVSRMKTIESSVQSSHRIEQIQKQCDGVVEVSGDAPRIRFVAVSATVSNPEDVASWLGTDDRPAVFHKFGDECRPVKLNRIVEGYPCAEGTSIFKFDIVLNYKLWPIIQKYHDGKPTLIFCNTRKSVVLTAETLSKELTINFNPEQKARLVALASTMKNKKLQSLIMSGVGCHHAGMLYEERMNIEHSFRNRDLPILITTTTLAMGVNLPAHLVIVKNTQQYVNGAYQEYSISTVLQMVGRAGRPQFDTEATAVIMTRLADKHRYQALVGGNEPLQSFLHKRLTENLNSEAALGTVGDVAQCVQWLRSTFLFVRAARDPRRYLGLPPSAPQSQISKKIEELCVKAMNGLATSGLITMDEASCIESTDAGRLMSIYYLDVETMKNIMKIDGTENLERLLNMVCDSHELSDMHLRVDERRCLNALNRNNTAATIRFPMKGKISTRQMKLNCMIQAVLGCLPIPDPSLNQEAMKVMRIADRICKCLVSYVTRIDLISQQPQYFSAILNSIILAKCVTAHLWENSPFVSKQLKGIGPTFSALLASAGKVNFMLLEESHPRDLERIMNKGPPAGNTLRKQINFLPKYHLTITPKSERTVTIELLLQNLCYLAENIEHLTAGEAHKTYIIVGDSDNYLLLLTSFKDKDLIKIYNGSITYEITRKRNCEHKIFVHCVSSNFVGIDVQCEFTFKDFETPLYTHIQTTTKNLNQKQTCITDVFKERKRKNENTQNMHKDKRRRESSILQKFNDLKEPFNETFETLNKNIRQTNMGLEISNEPIFHEISSEDNIQTLNIRDGTNTNNLSENNIINSIGPVINLEDSDEEYLNDDKLNSILDNIESEISEMNNILKSQTSSSKPIPSLIPSSNDNITKETSRFNTPQNHFHQRHKNQQMVGKFQSNPETRANIIQKARKAKNVKSNYSFIDILDKNDATIDDKDNTIVTDITTGFSSAIKSNIDKYLERMQHSSKESGNAINKILHNTDNCNLPSVDMVKQHTTSDSFVVDTIKNCNSSDQTLNLNSQHANDIEISVDIQNLGNTVHENIPEKKLTIESSRKDEFIPERRIMEFSNIINSNTLIESLQNKPPSITNVTDRHSDENVLKPESNILDTNTNIGIINQIDNNSTYESSNLKIQDNEIAETSGYEQQIINEDKFSTSDPQIDFLDSGEIKKLSRKLYDIENCASITDYISKYSFTATSVSVRSLSQNFVHVIKKLKVNVDIAKTVLSNKIINNDTITETIDQSSKTGDTLSMKESKIATKALLPPVCKAIERTTEPVSTEIYKVMEHPELSMDKSNQIESTTNTYVNTTPKCFTYELKEKPVTSNYNLKVTCDDGKLHNCGNITEVNEISKDNSINKDLTDRTGNNFKQIIDSDYTTESDRQKIAVQKCGGYKVAEILQKYSSLLSNNADKDIHKGISSSHRDNNRQETNKTERPFKISDIQKLDVDLPQGLINEISGDSYKYAPSRFPIFRTRTLQHEKCTDVQTFTPLNRAEQIENPPQGNEFEKNYLEKEDSELQWVSECCQEPTPDFNIHESMFDPKTLLQCLDNDSSDTIIPPPPEFCDKVDYRCFEELTTITLDTESNHNIFPGPDQENSELTPRKEIESWVISPKINYDSFADMNLIQTCTTMNRNHSTNERLHIPAFSRYNKLKKFKFSQKSKMKI